MSDPIDEKAAANAAATEALRRGLREIGIGDPAPAPPQEPAPASEEVPPHYDEMSAEERRALRGQYGLGYRNVPSDFEERAVTPPAGKHVKDMTPAELRLLKKQYNAGW